VKKFTKILENIEGKKSYRVIAQVELTIEAENEGEASYIADSTLSALKNQSNYTINKIEDSTGDKLSDE